MKSGKGKRPSSSALGHLAAAMAHEVRNPLNSIVLHVELLSTRIERVLATRDNADMDALRRSLTTVNREVERIDGILTEYLAAVAPVEAARRTTEVGLLLASVEARVGPRAEARGVQLVVERAAASLSWAIAAGGVAEALEAVVMNAIEASASGGKVMVHAGVAEEGGCFIEVTDHGEGLPAEQAAQAFHLGYSTRPGHPGLGLTVARQIVKIHGGTILLRSEGPGKGTTVRMELPSGMEDEEA